MKSSINKIIGAVIILVAAVAVGSLVTSYRSEQKLGNNAYESTRFSVASTTGAVSVTTSTRVLATTTAGTIRAYAKICNDSAQKLYFNMDQDKKASLLAGTPVAANTCFEITGVNLYQGSITASSTNETASSVSVYSVEL